MFLGFFPNVVCVVARLILFFVDIQIDILVRFTTGIAGIHQDFRQQFNPRWSDHRAAVMVGAQGGGVHAGVNTGARRGTYGSGCEGVGIVYPFGCQPVDIGRAGIGVAVAAIVPGAGVVGADL